MFLINCVVFIVVFNFVRAQKELFTGDFFQYHFFPVYGTSTQFKVNARWDAHIALTTLPRELGYYYEVVIGGWGNSRSAIRKRTCFPWEREEAPTPQILSASEYRSFWIKWDFATIKVGREGEAKPFMTWLDLEPVAVSHLGVHTGFGSTGAWEIDNLDDSAGSKSVQTGDNKDYQFFPISKEIVTFKVRATNDAYIGLSSDSTESDPMYEVIIGGWGNTKSMIKRKSCFHPVEKQTVATPRILNANQFKSFMLQWTNGRISVWEEGRQQPLMGWWQDPNPLNVTHIGIRTGSGAIGSWKIKNLIRENDEERDPVVCDQTKFSDVETPDVNQYQYFPISTTSLHFKVRASSDVHIGLSTGPYDSNPMYEIVLGGWSNSQSVLRKSCCPPDERVGLPTPEILKEGTFRGFWLNWENGNIKVGKEGESNPFLQWKDPDPEPILVNYFGVHTGLGSTGLWKLASSTVDDQISHKLVVAPLTLPSRASAPAPTVCGTTLTRLRQGTACAGQTVFEDNFEKLREDVWTVQQYVPIDHPELPFVSYQRFTVSVRNGHLRITPVLQQAQQGFTYYSLYGILDLYNGCTSGQSSSCSVKASDGASIIPPVVSGRVTSRSSFAFTYGTITVRAKLPQGDWIYPEILLEPLVKKFVFGTKNSGMLKIACARGNLDLSWGTTQYGNKALYSGPVIDTMCHTTLLSSKQSDKNWGDEFHVYSVKWTPDNLILSVDGEEYGRVEPSEGGLRANLPNRCAGPDQPGMAPFDDHFYITLGMAAGGHTEFPDASLSKGRKKPWKNQASKATLNFWNDIDAWRDTWEFPNLLVDYVKVVAL